VGHGLSWLLGRGRTAVANSATDFVGGSKRGWEAGRRGEAWDKEAGIQGLAQKAIESLNKIIPQIDKDEQKQWLLDVVANLSKIK